MFVSEALPLIRQEDGRNAADMHADGKRCVLSGQLEEAGEHFRKAAELAPEVVTYAFDLAVWLDRAEMVPLAIDAYRRVVSLDGTHPGALQNLAALFLQHGRSEEAVTLLRSAPASVLQQNPELLSSLAVGYAGTGNHEHAVEYLEQALTLAPDSLMPAMNLGRTLVRLHRYGEAFRVFDAVVGKRTDAPEILTEYASIRLDLGFFDEAGTMFAAAFRQGFDTPEVRRGLAAVAFRSRDTVDGRHIRLRPFSRGRADFIRAAFDDTAFMRRMGRSWSLPRESALLEEQLERNASVQLLARTSLEWVIEDVASETPIGIVAITDLDWASSRGELAMGFLRPTMSLGSQAVETALLSLHIAFGTLRLRKLVSFVYDDNPQAQQSTLSLGFSPEGIVREHLYDTQTGEWVSLHLNSMLEREFRNNRRLARLSQRVLGRDVTVDSLSTA